MRIKKAIILFLMLFILASPCFAAWTVTANLENNASWNNDQQVYRIKVYALSDGTDLAEFNLSDEFDGVGGSDAVSFFNEAVRGGMFHQVETDPGVAPDATWAVTFSSDLGASILPLTGLSVTETQLHNGAETLGFKAAVFDLRIDIGDIGSSGDEVTLYIYIIK